MSEEEEDDKDVTHPEPVVLWNNRRRMAWLSTFSIVATTVWAYLNPGATEAQQDLLISAMWVQGAIVGAYMGFKMVQYGFGKGAKK